MMKTVFVVAAAFAATTLRAQDCAPLPDDFEGFSAIYYVSEPDASGDRVVVGALPSWFRVDNWAMPAVENQQYCGSVALANGLSVTAYVPTPEEANGNFFAFGAPLYDPTTATGGDYPSGMTAYEGNSMPDSAEVFGWRIAAVDPPSINEGGVVNGASNLEGITAGSWVTVYGRNLSRFSRAWAGPDFNGNLLPTVLDGTEVTFNGVKAATYYGSPGQLNVQAPDLQPGPVSVQVTSPFGQSPPLETNLVEYAPAWFLAPAIEGLFPAAVHPNGELVGRPEFIGIHVASRQARVDHILLLYGTGFGPTDPPVQAGQLVAQAASLTDPSALTITFGGVEVPEEDVQFAGLTGAGLYQFNVRVPPVPPGDHALEASIGGATTQPGVMISVVESGIISEGSGTLHGTWLYDFDAGHESFPGDTSLADVSWSIQSAVERTLRAATAYGASFVNIGVTDFDAIGLDTLLGLNYGTEPINGNDDESNQLVEGDVFAVKTSSNNYAKVVVESYGYNLGLRWVTYAGPETLTQ